LQNAAGNVAFPSYTFFGDGNTGMYRIGSDVIGFGTGGAERVRIDSTGIAFHGDTATANHLNDYEEGTFSGTTTTANLSSKTISNQTYTKIGRRVFLQMKMIATIDDVNARMFISQVVPIAAASNTYPFSGGGMAENNSSPFEDIAMACGDSSASTANTGFWGYLPVKAGAHTFNLFMSYEAAS